MRKFKYILTLAIWVMSITLTLAESGSERKADHRIVNQDFEEGIKMYQEILKGSSDAATKIRVTQKLAKVYYVTRNYKKSLSYYTELLEAGQEGVLSIPEASDVLNMLNRVDDKAGASKWAAIFAKNDSLMANQKFRNLQRSIMGIEIPVANDTLNYTVTNEPFNTPYSEFWTGEVNDKNLVFIRNDANGDAKNMRNMFTGSQFYVYNKKTKTARLYDNFPVVNQAGPATFSKDGKEMIYTDNNMKSGGFAFRVSKSVKRNLQLVYATYSEKHQKWKTTKSVFKSNNQNISYCHPSFADNDKVLFFSANIPGGHGGADIYKVKHNSVTGDWDEPINLGPVVNTAGDELYPLVKGHTLYFSSDGQIGQGGYDIYSVQLTADFTVADTVVTYYPYPINTRFNDYSMFMNDDNKSGMFTSDRNGGKGSDDIYSFAAVVKEQAKKLVVADTVAVAAVAPPVISVRERDTLMTIIKHEEIGHVYFAYDQSKIENKVNQALEAALVMINSDKYKDAQFMLLGSADVRGRADYNMRLSERRAESVKKWLVDRGVSPDRLIVTARGAISLSDAEIRKELNLPAEGALTDAQMIQRSYNEARRVTIKVFGAKN